MDDHRVYLEKLAAFGKLLRSEGISVTPQETADACRILLQLGFADRNRVKLALGTVYAKSREEQLIFSRVFDGFFVSEEVMRSQAMEQAQRQAELDAIGDAAQEQLQVNGESMLMNREQRQTFASMPKEEREKLMRFLEKYRSNAQRNPELYSNFIHSVFAKSLLEQHLRMEDAAVSAAAADPEIGLLFRDISKFRDEEIPRAITLIQAAAQQVNAELSARQKAAGTSDKLDFRKTIRKGLETGGSFYRLKFRKKPRRRKHMVLLCDVSGSMIQFSEFALRFIQTLNQASDSSRTFLFSETVFEADPFSLRNMDLFRELVGRSGIYGKGTNLAQALSHLRSLRPPVLTDATTLIILSDTKTIDQQGALNQLRQIRQLCGRVIFLNPIPESQWQYLHSVQTFASACTMISCSTLQSLAAACRKLTLSSR